MDRGVPWLVFGLVVALVVTVGSMGLALVLPGVAAGGDYGVPMDRDRAGWPFHWDSERGADARALLAPLWTVFLIAVPLLLLGVAIMGLVWATRSAPSPVDGVPLSCRSCGEDLEPDWLLCPCCGERTENAHD
jgi:hypothetical protein